MVIGKRQVIKKAYMAMTSKGITYGTFDALHFGHINLFKRIKKQVDYLIVYVSTDNFNKIKGKKSYHSYKERKELVKAISYVDEVRPEKNWKQKYKDIKEADKMFMGDDWKGKFDDLNCIYLPRTKEISSTKIREVLK